MDSSKHRPNRHRCDGASAFGSVVGTARTGGRVPRGVARAARARRRQEAVHAEREDAAAELELDGRVAARVQVALALLEAAPHAAHELVERRQRGPVLEPRRRAGQDRHALAVEERRVLPRRLAQGPAQAVVEQLPRDAVAGAAVELPRE